MPIHRLMFDERTGVKSYVVAAVSAGSLLLLAGCGSSTVVPDNGTAIPAVGASEAPAQPSPPSTGMGDFTVGDAAPVDPVTAPQGDVGVEGIVESMTARVGVPFTISYTPDMRVGNTLSIVIMDDAGNPTDIVKLDSEGETKWTPNHKFTASAAGSADIVFIELDESGEQVGTPLYYNVLISE